MNISNKHKVYNIVRAIISIVSISVVFNIPEVSIYSLLLVVGFAAFYDYVEGLCIKDKYARIGAVIFALFVTVGMVEYWWVDEVPRIGKIIRLCFLLFGSYYIFYNALQFLFIKYDGIIARKDEVKCTISKDWIWIVSFIMIGISWGITWMADFPAVITPDTVSQIMQIKGDAPLDNFNPLANTLWLKLQYELLHNMGIKNINAALGVMSLLQLIIIDAIVSFQIKYLYSKTRNLIIVFFSIAFYTLTAYHASFSVTVGKDAIFSGIILGFMLAILRYFESDDLQDEKINLLVIFLLGLMVNLFRGNGYYAYMFILPVAIIYGIRKQKKEKKLMLCIGFTFLLSTVIISFIYKSVGIVERPYAEGLSIPIQQVASIVASDVQIDKEDYELLSRIVDVEQMGDAYTEWISDPVKRLFTNKEYFEEYKIDYLKLWIKLGIQNPKNYLFAYVNQTCGYWFPAVDTWPYDMGVADNVYGIIHTPILPQKIVENIKTSAEKYLDMPVYGSFWCIATYTWVTLCMFLYSIRRKNQIITFNYVLLLGIWVGLLICTPVHATFRYIYPLVIAAPLILFMPYATTDLEDDRAVVECKKE